MRVFGRLLHTVRTKCFAKFHNSDCRRKPVNKVEYGQYTAYTRGAAKQEAARQVLEAL